MIIYSTKPDVYGNKYPLIVDTEERTFSRTSSRWIFRDDYIAIGKRDRHKLIAQLRKNGFREVEMI